MGFLNKIFGAREATPTAVSRQTKAATPPEIHRPPAPKEMSTEELLRLMANGTPPLLIDVREAQELQMDGRIPGSIHMPMSSFQGRESELDPEHPVVIQCASGMRSQNVGCYLLDKGFKDVSNLTGGIHAWTGERVPG